MFCHNLKYAFKTMIKNKSAIIWTMLFPIALATFMFMAFGNLFEKDEVFSAIPVAVVIEADNEGFEAVIEELSKEGDAQLLKAEYMTDEEAKNAINEKSVSGIMYVGEDISLVVNESTYQNTVLKTIIAQYKKSEKVITEIAMKNPAAVSQAVKDMTGDTEYFVEKTSTNGSQDVYTTYFYAIFAMSCLFGSFAAAEKISKIQANESALGMRRCLSPNNKMIVIVAEFVSMLVVQFIIEVITLIYLTALGVDFGNRYPQILVILFFGSCIGIALGIIIGSVSKWPEGMRAGICVSISMALSVMADLCAHGIKDAIEHTVPIINRLNPAALIVDSFYALNIYDTYDRYIRNIATLGIMSVVLLVVSFLMVRRNKYASL